MENWGLIGFQESALLYEPEISPFNLYFIKLVIAHEIAHQWFGNLVTPEWWSDTWVKEGFADFFMIYALDQLQDRTSFDEIFIGMELQPVLVADGMINSHKTKIEVLHPDEIRDNFDLISYKKGASIIRMAYYFLTPRIFRNGLRRFLKEK